MSIEEIRIKIKGLRHPVDGDIVVILIIIFVGLGGFGMGRLSVSTGNIDVPVKLINEVSSRESQSASSLNSFKNEAGLVVASRNGTKYHYPWCSGAKRMKEENKVWFDSITSARAVGLSPAANCKGLK